MIYWTPLKQKPVFFVEKQIGDHSKNCANLTWIYPNAFELMRFLGSVRSMDDPVKNSSANSSAVQRLTGSQCVKPEPQRIVTLECMFTVILSLGNGS